MPDLPPKRKMHDPIEWDGKSSAPSSPLPGQLDGTHKVHEPIDAPAGAEPPLTPRPSRRAFLDLCESIRFRLDVARPLEPLQRKEIRRAVEAERSRLLGKALRVDEVTTPEVADMVSRCCQRLRRAVAPEVFIGGPHDNAFSASVAPDDLQLIAVSGSLLDALTETEILCVIGHEMGHQALHSGASMDAESEFEAVSQRLASQAREISADRVGLLACLDLESVATGLVWITTRLPRRMLRPRLDRMLSQIDEIPARFNAWQLRDEDQDHPFLQFRLWAIWKFAQTDVFQAHLGKTGGVSFSETESEITRRFETLGGGQFGLSQRRHVSEAAIWLATLILSEVPGDSANARRAFKAFAGAGQADDFLELFERCGAEEIRSRAVSATQSVLSSDLAKFETIERRLDAFCLEIGLNLKGTEAWVVLSESRSEFTDR
jgi:hypothetical protein